jgi:predicted O-methyltransferase YrrM
MSSNPMLPLVEFIRRTGAAEDPVLAALRSEVEAYNERSDNRASPLTPEAGKLLYLLAKATRAKSILEVGTGFGYSGIWLARALPRDGQLKTVEADPEHAKIAEGWFRRAQLASKVEVVRGKAIGVLPAMPTKFFDFVFIDADKANYPRYLELAMRVSKPGSVICADNVFWFGAALSEDDTTPDAIGVREYNRMASSHPSLETLIVPLGDGLSVSVRSD